MRYCLKDFPIAELKKLKAGQTKLFNYEYTVKEKEVTAGSLTITSAVLSNGEEVDYGALFDESLTYTVKTSAGTSSVDPHHCCAYYQTSSSFLRHNKIPPFL